MAVELIPYVQDEKRWTDHYMAQAMKQMKSVEVTKPLHEQNIHPSIVLPTMQLAAQAQSEMQREKTGHEVYAPVKIRPEFHSAATSSAASKGTSRKRKADTQNSPNPKKKSQKTEPETKIKKKRSRKESSSNDIFNHG